MCKIVEIEKLVSKFYEINWKNKKLKKFQFYIIV